MAAPLTVDELDEVVATLRAAGCVYAEDEAAVIVEAATTSDDVRRMLAARGTGRPLEVVVGWAAFFGGRIVVEAGVFVPRRRTEVVVQEAVRLARPGAVVVDLCCGTGAIGAAVAWHVKGVTLWAADLEPAAVRCARRNVEPLGGTVVEGDLFDALPGTLKGLVDVLAVNAPYVPTDAIATMPPEARDHEPRMTLDGGIDGLAVQRRVADEAADWLSPGGHLLVETSRGQALATVAAFVRGGLAARVVTSDEVDGTVVVGERQPAGG